MHASADTIVYKGPVGHAVRMDVKQFRTLMQSALRDAGLEAHEIAHRRPKLPSVWALPADDIIRYFSPHATRRPWGFVYSGYIGVEIPALRTWLKQYKSDDAGIFHTWFVGYYIMNDDVLGNFAVEHGEAAPFDLWAGLIKDRIATIPQSLEGLVSTYRRNREELGWLAHPHERHAWNFLLNWLRDPNPTLEVPRMLPDGRIV